MALFAALALSSVNNKCAVLWLGVLLLMALAHFAETTVVGSNPLASLISNWCSFSSGFIVSGTLNTIILQFLFQNSALAPSLSQSLPWFSMLDSQVAVSSVSASITVPPFLEFTADW